MTFGVSFWDVWAGRDRGLPFYTAVCPSCMKYELLHERTSMLLVGMFRRSLTTSTHTADDSRSLEKGTGDNIVLEPYDVACLRTD